MNSFQRTLRLFRKPSPPLLLPPLLPSVPSSQVSGMPAADTSEESDSRLVAKGRAFSPLFLLLLSLFSSPRPVASAERRSRRRNSGPFISFLGSRPSFPSPFSFLPFFWHEGRSLPVATFAPGRAERKVATVRPFIRVFSPPSFPFPLPFLPPLLSSSSPSFQ